MTYLSLIDFTAIENNRKQNYQNFVVLYYITFIDRYCLQKYDRTLSI